MDLLNDEWYHDVLDKHLKEDRVTLWTTGEGDECEVTGGDTMEMKQLLKG